MKLIIDIPEDLYNKLVKYKDFYKNTTIFSAITDGISYENKGDLISREALKKEIESLVVGGEKGLKDYYEKGSKADENAWIGGIYDVWELVVNAPTVEYSFYQEAYQTGYEEGFNEGAKAVVDTVNKANKTPLYGADMIRGEKE